MAAWECPKCGVANLADDRSCRACGTWRPEQRVAPHTRSAVGAIGTDILADMRRLNESLLGDIQTELRAMTGASMSPLPATPVPATVATARTAPAGVEQFARASTRTLRLTIAAVPKLNFAMVHAGLPLIRRLVLTNNDQQAAHDLVVRVWVSPDYGDAWQTTVADIQPGHEHVEERIVVPLTKARLQEVREAERASLRIDVTSEGTLVQSQTLPLEVLAYNEWYFHPAMPHTLACFVQPNSAAVERVVSLVRDRLRRQSGDPSIAGYQEGGSPRVIEMTAALYETLQQDAGLSYINPPASFEQPQMLEEGGFTISQKVFLPEQILEYGRGTCLDLALLGASCLERMGLHPVLFVVRGHAFFGVWLEPGTLRDPWTRDETLVRQLVDEGKWLPVNSTTFTTRPSESFQVCADEARNWLAAEGQLLAAVDIRASRQVGVKPIPPIVTVA